MKIIISGDGLYSKQPFIDKVKKAGMSYVLVAKPTDHKVLFEWVDELNSLGVFKGLRSKIQKAGHIQHPEEPRVSHRAQLQPRHK